MCELCGVSDSEPDVSKAHLSDEWSDSRSEGRGGRLTWCCWFCIVAVWGNTKGVSIPIPCSLNVYTDAIDN